MHVVSAFSGGALNEYITEIRQKQNDTNSKAITEIESAIPHAIFYDTYSRPGSLLAYSVRVMHAVTPYDYDLAILRSNPHAAFKKGFPTIETQTYEEIKEGDEIATCGFPLGVRLQEQLGTVNSSFTRGVISSIIPSQGVPLEYLKGFQLNLTATHGNSGGPVFLLSTGNAFGVLQRGVVDDRNEIIPGIIKAEPIYPALKDNAIGRLLEFNPDEFLEKTEK
jgi:hypothetical protein